MEHIKKQIKQFSQSLKTFNNQKEEDWKKNDVEIIAREFKYLIDDFKQTCIDYGLKNDGQLKAPETIVVQINDFNNQIKILKQNLTQALSARDSKINGSN